MGKHSKNLLKRSRYTSFSNGYTIENVYEYDFDASGRVMRMKQFSEKNGEAIYDRPTVFEYGYSK